jgi:hypothetical protein
LQCDELTKAVNTTVKELGLKESLQKKLTQEQKYLARQQGVDLAFTPVVIKEEGIWQL